MHLLCCMSPTIQKNKLGMLPWLCEQRFFAIPPSKNPSPTSVHTLKDNAPSIPPLTLLFFRTLIGGMQSSPKSAHSKDVIERKAVAGASDAVFNCTRGTVCPWKHQFLGLGLGTLTGSKSLLTVLNRFGHCISYDEVKRLETEMAYSCSDTGCETPDGLNLHSNLATGKTNTNSLLVHDVLLLCFKISLG